MSPVTNSLPPPTRKSWPRTALIALASVEACFALLQTLRLFDPDGQLAIGQLVDRITMAHLVAAPILALAALAFALCDRMPQAIVALAVIVLTDWASEVASTHLTGIKLLLAYVVPVVAVVTIVLAAWRIRPALAVVLIASLYMVWVWFVLLSEVLPFVIAVMIYGA